jgi:hypothetical protein
MMQLTACTTVSKEWPVGRITLPAGAVEAGLPQLYANDPNVTSSEDWRGGGWYKCFDCPGGWDGVLKHFESCLTPLGYKYDEAETKDMAPPQVDPAGFIRVYSSPSGQVKAALMDLHECARHGEGFDGGGQYLIMVGADGPK